MGKRKGVLNSDVSNRVVVILFILVVIITIISLGIYVNSLESFNRNYSDTPKTSSGKVSLIIDKSPKPDYTNINVTGGR